MCSACGLQRLRSARPSRPPGSATRRHPSPSTASRVGPTPCAATSLAACSTTSGRQASGSPSSRRGEIFDTAVEEAAQLATRCQWSGGLPAGRPASRAPSPAQCPYCPEGERSYSVPVW